MTYRRHDAHFVVLLVISSVVVLLAKPAPARAQVDTITFEMPAIIDVKQTSTGTDTSADLDLRNVVQSAARRVTTIQQASAIVSVITADEIADRGWTTLDSALDTIPGWLRIGGLFEQFPGNMVRGLAQAVLFMHNGVSLFDSNFNVASMWRIQPLETIKRVEVVTGPGGVLWGANSFVGIVNVITKDADDVDGVEAAVRMGDGNGDRRLLRGYAMAGWPDLLGGRAKLFVHSSFETYDGPSYQLPGKLFSQPLPQPNSQLLYGPLRRSDAPRSFLFNMNAKLSVGDLNIYAAAPFVQRHTPLGFFGFVVEQSRAEDFLTDANGNALCPMGPPTVDTTGQCLDPARASRDNRLDWFDRYVVAEYGKRVADGKAGFTAKAYAVQFNRDYKHLGILKPIAGLEGGLAFGFDATSYRAGSQIDSDVSIGKAFHLLFGAEAFHAWVPPNTSNSIQGNGTQSTFTAPYDVGRLPLPCPRGPNDDTGAVEYLEGCPLTFSFAASRSVLGAYVSPHWAASKKLTFDAGARLQIAPKSLGKLGYPLQTVFSGAAVWGFVDNWHLKLNYAEGFRPPVFNNTNSNGASVQIDGDPDIEVESSRAGQVEVNARLFSGNKRIRELNFRADYSYTAIDKLISVVAGRYVNSGKRGIHSAELLGKLYVKGGHRIELGYTWLKMAMADSGTLTGMPEHWFNVAGVFRLSSELSSTINMRIVGAAEDPNRIVEYRDYMLDDQGRVINTNTMSREPLVVWPHELVVDRLAPVADVTIGLRYRASNKLEFSAFAYNVLNQLSYQPDAFQEYEPRLQFTPNPNKAFRFVMNATLKM